MEITSHFLGITLNTKPFVSIFVSLQQYLKQNQIEHIIELQNIYSLHVSLYYLEKDIIPQDLKKIKDTLIHLEQANKNFVLTASGLAYFQKNNIDYLGYITCSQREKLTMINEELAEMYKRDFIHDNQYPYIPHISLFRIINKNLFQQHKEKIEDSINTSLIAIKQENIFQGCNLFAVNSKYTPEKQWIVTSF